MSTGVVTSHTPDQLVQGPVHRFVDRVLWDEPESDWRLLERLAHIGDHP